MKLSQFTSRALAASLVFAGCVAFAQTPEKNVAVKGAWIRSTVAGQQASGAFMKITAKEGTRLIGVSTPVAGVAEVHQMKMENDIMQMRAVPVLDLPAGKAVELKPGGYHVMMMDLKRPLLKGSTVPLTLRFKDAKGVESRLDIMVPVSTLAPGAAATAGAVDAKAGGHDVHKH